MASHNNIKVHEHSFVAPTSLTQTASLPLTFFDLFWIRNQPVERIFFFSFHSQSHSSFFFEKVVPNLKTSLSHALQHFFPLAGKIVWPCDFKKPIIHYTPGDAVSFVVAESDADFNHVLSNTPHETAVSRSLIPHLESSDSHASVISLQITLFPNRGFSIGISAHHAVLDGKSSTLFLKAWAFLCQTNNEELSSSSLVPELVPFFERTVIKEPTELGARIHDWTEVLSKLFPHKSNDGRSLKILPSQPKIVDTVRATFVLTRVDLDKIKKRVLSKWDDLNGGESSNSKPKTLSTFVITCAYTLVCIAKAIKGVQKERQKFAFGFTVDCRNRLEPPIPENYCGNCVWGQLVDTDPLDFIKEEGVVIVAKSIYNKIKKLDEGVFQGADKAHGRYIALAKEGVEVMGIAGSNRFGVYGIDFGWGKPSKVEITSVDRGLTFGFTESKDGKGGVEVGLVLNKHEMDLFDTFFHGGLCDD
ncbi:phenolic glucoside malonyltransferase 1-like [Abrus precatorius]|uniref:Phenolic glucoside malonyltransferase 1-like n=1 Tax=Abrus precatorius TaxID=3816 RepID=A0A8B8L036_ABRPR|nr:phenolic glucoside malonyltransferase 1-like [Abrus precatorius]